VKKARKAKLISESKKLRTSKVELAKQLFELAEFAQSNGWNAEELLQGEIKKREKTMRRQERASLRRS
jgi:hypothetical protein